MKNVLILSAFLAALAAPLFAVGDIEASGPIIPDKRFLPPFQSVNLIGVGEVVFTIGSYAVVVETNESLRDYVETDVHNGELVLKIKDEVSVWGPLSLRFLVSAPALERVTITGSGSCDIDDLIEGKDFKASILGSGSINADIKIDRLQANIAGSGQIRVKGSADEASIGITGSGDLKADKLKVGQVTILVAGSGDTFIDVSDQLDVSIVGSGDIYYSGYPKISISDVGSGQLFPQN